MAEDGDGKERDEIVHHAESGDERDAREEVDRGRDEVARGQGQAREEDAPARGVADARHALDGRFDDVQEQKGGEEREERRAEEGLALPWPCVGRHVHALAKVPSETAQREHEVERILEPRRKHRREKCVIAIACGRRRRILRRRLRWRIWLAGGNCCCSRDGFALFVAALLGESEIDALADDDKGEGGGAPVVDVVSWVEPDVAVGRVEGCGDECREQEEADQMGVGASDEVGHEGERDELEEGERGGVPCYRDAVFVWGHERSECPGAPGEPDERIREGQERERENDGRTLGTTGRSRCCFACLAGLLPCLSREQDYKCAGHASDR